MGYLELVWQLDTLAASTYLHPSLWYRLPFQFAASASITLVQLLLAPDSVKPEFKFQFSFSFGFNLVKTGRGIPANQIQDDLTLFWLTIKGGWAVHSRVLVIVMSGSLTPESGNGNKQHSCRLHMWGVGLCLVG